MPGADADTARRAGRLAKADLTTEMVFEFPELQGTMGGHYARHDGEDEDVAGAVAEHYLPAGPSGACPSAPVSVAVALADRIDTLVGFFAVGERPTGSGDPYALRRAALGVIRLVLENGIRLPLREAFRKAYRGYGGTVPDFEDALEGGHRPKLLERELLDFFADRLKVHLRSDGVRHDLIAAVFALGDEDDLVRLRARVEALRGFLATEDGANLLTAHKRAANIVAIEEKKDGVAYAGPVESSLLSEPEERALSESLDAVGAQSAPCGRERGVRRGHDRARGAARAGRRVLRPGEGQRRRRRAESQSAEAAVGDPGDDGQPRRLLPDRGLAGMTGISRWGRR